MKSMEKYDLCLAWNWPYDHDFVAILNQACQARDLSLVQATPDNLHELLTCLHTAQIDFQVLIDRVSESDSFFALIKWAHENGRYCINSLEKAPPTWDKARMHGILIEAGLQTPYTIILPSFKEQPDLPKLDLHVLGERFTIKPAHGGGGEGVVMDANQLCDVLAARQAFPEDRYLLQNTIIPRQIETLPAYFRVLYCAGEIYPCWWNPETHLYTPLHELDEARHCLFPLRKITGEIAGLAGLDLFSTEIAYTQDDRFVVVDYVNDQLDLRLQSRTGNGVPDQIVCRIAERLAELVDILKNPVS
jgi:hypothetical protein